MLTSRQPTRTEIPHEPGNVLVGRPLSGRQLEEAAREGTRRALALMADAPASMIKAQTEARQEAPAGPSDDDLRLTREQAEAADAGQPEGGRYSDSDYAVDVVLSRGVVGFDGPGYTSADGDGPLPIDVILEDLDARTREWAYQTILSGSNVPS